MTALADALRAAGIKPAAERLEDVARAAIAENPRDFHAAYQSLRATIRSDADLCWALFSRWEESAMRPLLARAAERYHADRRVGAVDRSGGHPRSGHLSASASTRSDPTGAAGRAAVTAAVSRSLLDTFMVNGRPIGDVGADEARTWARARRREARFVELLTHGITDNQPIRRWITPDEAEAAMKRAGEQGNE